MPDPILLEPGVEIRWRSSIDLVLHSDLRKLSTIVKNRRCLNMGPSFFFPRGTEGNGPVFPVRCAMCALGARECAPSI